MKRINTEEIYGKNFIGMWDIENDNLLKNIIDFFNNNHESHKPGTIALGKTDKNKKDLLELTINPKQVKENKIEIFNEYINNLIECYNDYQEQWDFLKNWQRIYIGPFKIEKHLVSGHHLELNCERQNINSSHKILSWITFLNDISDDEGNIIFNYYNIAIKPKKGTTLIFPSDWTHLHQQEVMKNSEKFTIRGSFHFPDTIDY
tara:strand:- start:9057 stop:9668 length:612 start_codon:yes stop_codon:yes gene_type:complete